MTGYPPSLQSPREGRPKTTAKETMSRHVIRTHQPTGAWYALTETDYGIIQAIAGPVNKSDPPAGRDVPGLAGWIKDYLERRANPDVNLDWAQKQEWSAALHPALLPWPYLD